MSDAIEIEHRPDENRYELLIDGEAAGELTYSRPSEGRILANHTFVDPRRRQKGSARKLVDRLAADAREQGARITPVCPYVRWVFEENPEEFDDVWER